MATLLRAVALLLLLMVPARADALAEPLAGLFSFDDATRPATLRRIEALHDRRATGALIQFLQWMDADERVPVVAALAALTGQPHDGWADWMVWQEQHPDIPTWPGYGALLRGVLTRIDPNFARFLPDDVAHTIRLEEIAWGGVRVDAIPALDQPHSVPAAEASYLADSDQVFGVAIGGQARAYPLRIVNWHEMVNDNVAGVPVSLAYCTLCGAGILFDTRVAGRAEPFTFGSSGLLYRSNKLMYDRQTDSLWNQFTGRPVVGALTGAGIALRQLPLVQLSWGAWRQHHPDTLVLDASTGYHRDYREGASYAAYFASPDLMFPAAVRDASRQKQVAFGVTVPGGVKAWPVERFAGGAVLNEQVGLVDVLVIGDGHFVRAYDRTGHVFTAAGPDRLRDAEGQNWQVTDDAVLGPHGASLPRLPGHLAYRFAWENYFPDAMGER